MASNIITLGIETSCDETAVAVLRGESEPLSSVVASQHDIHSKYGGIVPELACRRHVESISPMVREALEIAGVTLDDIGLVAATRGPGLVGALLVGLSYAKGLAWGRNLPLIGVNHLEGHMMAAFVERPDTPLPMVALLVSGGHTELFLLKEKWNFIHLGGTRDDAAGEAFDKVAKMLGLGFPGGPEVEAMALRGKAIHKVPVAMKKAGNLDFSFSGPKTAVKYLATGPEPATAEDLCASFQSAVGEALVYKTRAAVKAHNPASIAMAGGVACNGALRSAMKGLGEEMGLEVVIPSPALCTDNAVMIAASGAARYLRGRQNPEWRDYMDMDADPSWIPGRE